MEYRRDEQRNPKQRRIRRGKRRVQKRSEQIGLDRNRDKDGTEAKSTAEWSRVREG